MVELQIHRLDGLWHAMHSQWNQCSRRLPGHQGEWGASFSAVSISDLAMQAFMEQPRGLQRALHTCCTLPGNSIGSLSLDAGMQGRCHLHKTCRENGPPPPCIESGLQGTCHIPKTCRDDGPELTEAHGGNAAAADMVVPGATMSGLYRLSGVGPMELK